MSNELKKSPEALLEVNGKELFKGLRVCKLGTWPGKKQDVILKRKTS